jgi:hypothetical protein
LRRPHKQQEEQTMDFVVRASRRRLLAASLAGLTLAAARWPRRADAAAPWLLTVSGPPLTKRVVIATWEENYEIGAGQMLPDEDPDRFAGRPFFRIAEYWGSPWDHYVADGNSLDDLPDERANQRARFYPRVGQEPGRFVFDSIPGPGALVRGMTKLGLQVLACHGVPVRFDEAGEPIAPNPPVACTGETTPGALPLQAP